MEVGLLLAKLMLLVVVVVHAWVDFRRAPKLSPASRQEPVADGELPTLVVLVPARNEEQNLGSCLSSLAAQTYPRFVVVVMDDGSTDGTAEIARAFASQDSRFQLRTCPEKPSGWQGKSWALASGASGTDSEWIAMIDADVRLSPDALGSAMRLALSQKAAMLSLLPALDDRSFWERVIQPVVGLLVFLCQPLWLARSRSELVVVANGQFLLVSRSSYERVGGHGVVRGAIVEDVELARAYKRAGQSVLLAPAFEHVSVRMYRGFEGIWRGWGKTFHPYVKAHPIRLWAGSLLTVGILVAPFVLVPAYMARGEWGSPVMVIEALSLALILGTSIAFRVRAGHEVGHALFLPLALIVLLAIIAERTYAIVVRRGVYWKGRNVEDLEG